MKKTSILILCITLLVAMVLSACSPFDPLYGTSDNTSSKNIYKDVKIPKIKSDDENMPTFFDISLFDEENYSDIYLGKKFEFKTVYVGSEISLPCDIEDMEDIGFKLIKDDKFNEESQILAGKSAKVQMINDYNKQLVAVFYNSSNSSKKLSKCDIVKVIIPENVYLNSESPYGQFFVNGVSNESAITDVIEYLGAPSHFYCVNETQYYLDYFVTKKDKRNGITVYIDIASDCVTAIEFSMYD